MRRTPAALAALMLVGSLAGASLATDGVPRSFFQGSFDLLDENGTLLGHATASLFEPTGQRLVPGSYDFKGAPGNPAGILESHAVIGSAHFWFDPLFLPNGATTPGAYVGRADGVECVYRGPNDTDCHQLGIQYVDNVDPSVLDEVQFYGYWGEVTQFVGAGGFTLRFSGVGS